MLPLPLANILHHRLRSMLSALGVAIAVCMIITLSGLARGTLEEVAKRWQGVNADIVVYPAHWGDNITTISGGGLGRSDVKMLTALEVRGRLAVERVVPVCILQTKVAGVSCNVVGISPEDFPMLVEKSGGKLTGRVFDPNNDFANWLTKKLTTPSDKIVTITGRDLACQGGLEIVIDSRLARASGLKIGRKVRLAGHDFTIVGQVPAGVLARAFIPLATAEWLMDLPIGKYTLMFVKLRDPSVIGQVISKINATGRLKAIALGRYRNMLEARFGIMYVYIDTVNTITLIVAMLFILVTLYTIVIQHKREIAILKSMGATRGFILREILTQAMILTGMGTAMGILLAPLAGAIIEAVMPLLTVEISAWWILISALAATTGGTLAAVYPAWCAVRMNPAEVLTLE